MSFVEEIKEIIEPVIREEGAELIDLELRGKPGNFRLSVFADTDEGISVEKCTKISRELLRLPELDKLLGEKYRLEVSSPGIDRPLKTEKDFQRKINVEIEVQYRDGETVRKIKGKLKKIALGSLVLATKNGEFTVPVKKIEKAVQALPW